MKTLCVATSFMLAVFICGANAFAGTEAAHKTFYGRYAGYSNTGYYNIFLGDSAGQRNTTGHSNTFLGNAAGYYNTTGYHNTFVGNSAGYYNITGVSNVFIGHEAGFKETGSNKLYIDNSATSSPLIYGDSAANTLTFNGSVNITGRLTKGSGTLVQPHPSDPSKEVVYALFEGPEHAVFLRGKAR